MNNRKSVDDNSNVLKFQSMDGVEFHKFAKSKKWQVSFYDIVA